MSEWQPVETAPKSRRVLVSVSPIIFPAMPSVEVAAYIEYLNRWVKDDGHFIEYGKVSHWMPLPEAPDTKKENP